MEKFHPLYTDIERCFFVFAVLLVVGAAFSLFVCMVGQILGVCRIVAEHHLVAQDDTEYL